jgi:serine/threonine protein kinase
VYEGRWCGKVCAVKVLFTVEIVPEEIDRTCLEASLLHRLQSSSVHVVRLFGVAVLPPSLCVVLELCSEGSLADVLYGKSDGRRQTSFDSNLSAISKKGSLQQTYLHELPWASRLELALGASRGVDAFARTFPGLSHNDVKSTNFLVDCPGPDAGGGLRYVVKIADVEFASHGVTPEHTRRGESPHWTAPEVLSGAAPVSPSSDVFALGSVLFEIMARQVPFGDLNDQDAKQRIVSGQRPQFPETSWMVPTVDTGARDGSGSSGNAGAADDRSTVIRDGGPDGVGGGHVEGSVKGRTSGAANDRNSVPSPPSYVLAHELDDFVASRARIRSLVHRIWAQDPFDRPTAADVAEEVAEVTAAYGPLSRLSSVDFASALAFRSSSASAAAVV